MTIDKLKFSKSWLNKEDFATYEDSEEQVREDMQLLHDETRDALNSVVDALTSSTGAEDIGASAPDGMSGESVQELIEQLAEAISGLAGNVQADGTALSELVAASLTEKVLGGYYSKEEVESIVAALGVTSVAARVASIENALGSDGVVAGEVVQEYPFTVHCAEISNPSLSISARSSAALFHAGELCSLIFSDSGSYINSVNVSTAEISSKTLSGDEISYNKSTAASYNILWVDSASEYMLINISISYFLVSLKSGASSKLITGSGYNYRGCTRTGDVITAMFYSSNYNNFRRRNVSGDSAESPAITKLDDYSEQGNIYDMLLASSYDTTFFVLRYASVSSELKSFDAATMGVTHTYKTNYAEAYALDGVKSDGNDFYFVMSCASGYCPVKCTVMDSDGTAVPSLTVGQASHAGLKFIAKGSGTVYAAYGSTLFIMNSQTLDITKQITLPQPLAAELCGLGGAELKTLWGEKYIPAGAYLVNVEGGVKSIRCGDNGSPEAYAVQCAPERRFAVLYDGNWYFYDCLLRCVWGMVPYTSSGTASA